MKKALLLIVAAAALALSVPAAFAKGGDGSGDDKGGNNPAQTSGKDDPAGHDAGDDKGGQAKSADDPANHDANDDSKARGASSSKGKSAAKSKKAKAKAGNCTIRSTSKLKANSPKNGSIQVEFEVESHVSGQVWNVLLTDNGKSFFKGKVTTKAPGRSFELRASAKNQAGRDAIWATATNPASGETCSASVSV